MLTEQDSSNPLSSRPDEHFSEPYGGLGILESNRAPLTHMAERLIAFNKDARVRDPNGFANTDEYYASFMIQKALQNPDGYFDWDRLKNQLRIVVSDFNDDRFVRVMEKIKDVIRRTAD